jgi:threonine/homoserine/homoserine lactone efflux protein
MAFLPQFIDPSGSALYQSLFLAALHFAIAMVWQCTLAAIVDRARRMLSHPGVHRVLDGLTGSILMLIGITLAIER